jgi:hypothetical protein
MNTLSESHEILDALSEAELIAVHSLLKQIKSTHDAGSQRIKDCLETLGDMDEMDQLVYVTALKSYLDYEQDRTAKDPAHWTEKSYQIKNFPIKHAEGIYIVRSGMTEEALRATGEFVSNIDFADMAESLALARHNGTLVSEFLYQWAAVHQPDSLALDYCKRFALPSGKLSTRRDYYSKEVVVRPSNIVFHRSLLDDYVEHECFEGDKHRAVINPIITLLATDDWDFAVSQLSKVQRRKLG